MYSEWKKLLVDVQKNILESSGYAHSAIIIKRNGCYYILSYLKKRGEKPLLSRKVLFQNGAEEIIDKEDLDYSFQENQVQYNPLKMEIYRPIYADTVIGVLFLKNTDRKNISNQKKIDLSQFNLFSTILQNLIKQKQFEKEKEAHLIREEEKNAKISELMWKQDADYYLISLLLTPFQKNENNCSNIQTEFILKQKNSFRFKNREFEIGGDLCITDTIKLHDGHSYTFFLNADAMGKSVQGAGGALVLGSVIEANLNRLKLKSNYNTFPEQCLKSFYLDMQNVFLSFNGSMYASICIGMIHRETGSLYYFNAEHPFTILYREGSAQFLEQEISIRKLGTPDREGDFFVRVFNLHDGDILFTGSDGKDDLIVVENGKERVLEDETLILNTINECSGDLDRIYNTVLRYGKLKDDLSMIKISYHSKNTAKYYETIPSSVLFVIKKAEEALFKKSPEEALDALLVLEEEKDNYPEVIKILGKIYFAREDFVKAFEFFDLYTLVNEQDNLYILSNIYSELLKILIESFVQLEKNEIGIEIIEEYLYINPWDNEYLYKLSFVYFRAGIYHKGADAGERLFLRDKSHFPNLLNLIRIYIKLKVKERAQYLAGLCENHPFKDEEFEKLKLELSNL